MKTLFNDKNIDAIALALQPQTKLLTFEGTVRSSKTVTAIQAFFYRVYNSDNLMHLIAGRDFDSINDNILEANGLGLLPQFSRYCSLKKGKIGGNYVELVSPKGVKKIKLAGYSNKAQWKKVLGGSIECIFTDEVNIADKQFIDECFARQTSFDNPFTIFTLNGDIPQHYIYTDYINKCKIIGNAPASIRADMDKVQSNPGWYYMHWTFEDNPIMTPEKIEYAKSLYPIGSYYYTIKILGERGTPGDLIFLDYISDSLVKPLKATDYDFFGIGFDIGATRAQNSITLTGFKRDFSSCAFFDKVTFKQCGYQQKTEVLKAFCLKCKAAGMHINYIAVDSAEQNYINDLRAEFKREGLPDVIPSYKATIKERIDLLIVLMSSGKILFNDTEAGRNILQAYKIAVWEENKKGQEREDKNQWQNDVMDSAEYSLTRHTKALLRSCAKQ
jgi:PBSX family phage terminase large subunit